MATEDAIVVLHHFDSTIHANIAKSKLDAYDIPCFLTEENMATLYQQAFAIKVRLHVFEKDREAAYRILFQFDHVGNDTVCPNCGSTSIIRDFPEKLSQELSGALKVMFFGVFMPEKKIFRCLHCNHEF